LLRLGSLSFQLWPLPPSPPLPLPPLLPSLSAFVLVAA
jgi:hypothetical protein